MKVPFEQLRGTRVSLESGSEGPSYDPYHYDEITVERGGRHVVTIRLGLGVDLTIDGVDVGDALNLSENDKVSRFVDLTGMTPAQAMRYHYTAKNRCPRCHSSRFVGALGGGFVGETVYGCTRCGVMMYDDFHISMIE